MWLIFVMLIAVPAVVAIVSYHTDDEKYGDPWENTRTKQPDDFV